MPKGVYPRRGRKIRKLGELADSHSFTPVIMRDVSARTAGNISEDKRLLRLASAKIDRLEGENMRLRKALDALLKGDAS